MPHIRHEQERGAGNELRGSLSSRWSEQCVIASMNHQGGDVELTQAVASVTRCVDCRKLALGSLWIEAAVILTRSSFARLIQVEVFL